MFRGLRVAARTDQRSRDIDAVFGALRFSLYDLLPRVETATGLMTNRFYVAREGAGVQPLK